MENNNVVAQPVETNFHLKIQMYALIKIYLRGIDSLSYVAPLMSQLQQVKIGQRVAVTVECPIIGKYTVVAVRKSINVGIVVTAWAHQETNIKQNVKSLLEACYEIALNGLSSWDIKKEKTKLQGGAQ